MSHLFIGIIASVTVAAALIYYVAASIYKAVHFKLDSVGTSVVDQSDKD